MSTDSAEFLASLRRDLAGITAPNDLLLQTALNEAWFSNILAWLLNPRSSHGLGVTFAQAFVSAIARKRVAPGDRPYARRSTFLKSGKAGPGVGATGFSFENAAALREYFLSGSVESRRERSMRYCDVVFLDLDSEDSFVLAIENKLFTSDHSEQLREYREAIEEKYQRAAVRELVYLTLRGDSPVEGERSGEASHWIRMSWVEDVAGLLDDASKRIPDRIAPAVADVRALLSWLSYVTDLNRFPLGFRIRLKEMLLRAAAECLYEELVRLDKPDGGQWRLEPTTLNAERISYTVRTAAYLTIDLTPALNVTVQGRRYDGKAEFEKIVVPFGAHPDQVINLLDIAARDVYHRFFGKPSTYLGNARRLRSTETPKEREHSPLFDFVHRYRHTLKAMLLQSAAVREVVGVKDEEVAEAQ